MKGLLTGLVILLWASMATAAAHSPINFTNGSVPCACGTVFWAPSVLSGGASKDWWPDVIFIDDDATASDAIGVQITGVTLNDTTGCGKTPDFIFTDNIVLANEGPTQAVDSLMVRNQSCTTHPRIYSVAVTCFDPDCGTPSENVTVQIQTSR